MLDDWRSVRLGASIASPYDCGIVPSCFDLRNVLELMWFCLSQAAQFFE